MKTERQFSGKKEKLEPILLFVLHQALNKPHVTRERPPLVALPMQKRSPMAVYPASNSVLVRGALALVPNFQIGNRNVLKKKKKKTRSSSQQIFYL